MICTVQTKYLFPDFGKPSKLIDIDNLIEQKKDMILAAKEEK
jgi:hypothetical protein